MEALINFVSSYFLNLSLFWKIVIYFVGFVFLMYMVLFAIYLPAILKKVLRNGRLFLLDPQKRNLLRTYQKLEQRRKELLIAKEHDEITGNNIAAEYETHELEDVIKKEQLYKQEIQKLNIAI